MFNHSARITLVKHIVVRLIQLPLPLHCSVSPAKQRQNTKRKTEPFFDCKRWGGKGWWDFWKGNVLQGCTEGEPRAGKHRRNKLIGCQNCSVSALQPGHLSSYLLTCSSAHILFNWALPRGKGIPCKRMSIALPVSARQGSAWNDEGGCFWQLCKSPPLLDLGRLC